MIGIGTSRFALATAAALALGGCARTCPQGATLRGAPPPRGTAQWCQRGAPTFHHVPAPGRTYPATIGIAAPSARDRVLDGPVTEWYETGELKSHGRFALTPAQRSVAQGVWTYWYRNGQRKSQVTYHLGSPVGCAIEWEEDGTEHTYLAGPDGEFHRASCLVVIDREATRLAARSRANRGAPGGPVRFSAAVGTAYLPSSLVR